MPESKGNFWKSPLTRSRIKSDDVKLPEMLLGYFIGPFGALLSSGIFTSILQNYFTDVLKLDLGFLTTLQLISTVLIVAANLIVGQLIERTKALAGKARPWILLSALTLSVSSVLMFIGGSSGSTAGGIKTVTFLVLVLTIWARARGKSTVCAFKRTIPDEQTQNAMIIAFIVLALAVFGGIFISATSPMGFTDAVYEAVSALATVGLSAGGTASLSIPAQILIIIYMYFGRVGVLTISLGFLAGNRAEERFRYAETNLVIG